MFLRNRSIERANSRTRENIEAASVVCWPTKRSPKRICTPAISGQRSWSNSLTAFPTFLREKAKEIVSNSYTYKCLCEWEPRHRCSRSQSTQRFTTSPTSPISLLSQITSSSTSSRYSLFPPYPSYIWLLRVLWFGCGSFFCFWLELPSTLF